MVATMQSGRTSVTGSVNAVQAGLLPTGAVIFNYQVAGTGSTVTAHTVTAGKTAYVTCFYLTGTANTYAALFKADGTTISHELRTLANASSPIAQGSPIATYAAGVAIKVVGSAATMNWILVIVEVPN